MAAYPLLSASSRSRDTDVCTSADVEFEHVINIVLPSKKLFSRQFGCLARQRNHRSMYVVTEKYICKEKCLSTHYECDGRSGSCICNHALLYNGKNCEHSNIFVSITFASLCFFSLAVVFVALKTLYFKWNCPKKKIGCQ